MTGRVNDVRLRGRAVRTPAERTGTVQLTLRACSESLRLVRLAVGAVAALGGAPPSAAADLKLAVTEACTNSVQHAYPEGTARDPRLTVRVSLEPGLLVVDVTDEGVGFDSDRASLVIHEGEERERGMGLPIIRAVTDTFDVYNLEPGTRLVFSKRFERR
jgi:anti-sigma regulatory factor (Ser/Thr protein kinase)